MTDWQFDCTRLALSFPNLIQKINLPGFFGHYIFELVNRQGLQLSLRGRGRALNGHFNSGFCVNGTHLDQIANLLVLDIDLTQVLTGTGILPPGLSCITPRVQSSSPATRYQEHPPEPQDRHLNEAAMVSGECVQFLAELLDS